MNQLAGAIALPLSIFLATACTSPQHEPTDADDTLARFDVSDVEGASHLVSVLDANDEGSLLHYDLDVDGLRFSLDYSIGDDGTLLAHVSDSAGEVLASADRKVDGSVSMTSANGFSVDAAAGPLELTADDIDEFDPYALLLLSKQVRAKLPAAANADTTPRRLPEGKDGTIFRYSISTASCKAWGCKVVLDMSCNDGLPVACRCNANWKWCVTEVGVDIWN